MVSHKRRQHPAGPLESAAAVHGDVVVDQGKIAGLPWDIEGDFVGEGERLPVIIHIHGGPVSQYWYRFDSLAQYFVKKLQVLKVLLFYL